MRILVLNYEYPPVGGGGGRVSRDVAEGLAARGHEVMVMAGRFGGLPDDSVQNGVRLVRLPCLRKSADRCSMPEMASFILMGMKPALALAQEFKPDVIHAHFAVPTGYLARQLARKIGCPYVITAHLGDVPGGVPERTDMVFRLINPLARPIWRDAAAVTAVSKFVGGLATNAYGLAPTVIMNGIRPESIAAEAKPVNSPARLVFAGRLDEQKNPLRAIKALWRLNRKDWRLDIVGDGPLRDKVESAIRENDLGGNITLLGWIEPEKVDLFIANADILLMPSRAEGMPMVGLQALASGVAIIGTDPIADLIDEGVNGRVVAQDSKSLGDAIGALLDDAAGLAAMKAASLQKARRFDLQASVSAYETVLKGAAKVA